jgi:hypothetical protein
MKYDRHQPQLLNKPCDTLFGFNIVVMYDEDFSGQSRRW